MRTKDICSVIFKIFIVLTAVCGILLQCGIADGQFSLSTFRMFTTLSNLAVAVYFICHVVIVLMRRKDGVTGGLPPAVYAWKFMATMGILLTGLVAHFMLRGMFDLLPETERFGITLLHYVVPAAVLVDFAVFDARGQVKAWMPLFAALFPLVYAAVSLTVVTVTGSGRYPYPFLDVDRLGWSTVALVMVGLAAAFVSAGYILYGIDRMAARRRRGVV